MNNIQFGGVPLYQFKNGLTVYQLEGKDLPVLKQMHEEVKKDEFTFLPIEGISRKMHRQDTDYALEDLIDNLTMKENHHFDDGSVSLLAVYNKKPVGLLGGNFLKIIPGSNKTTHSFYDTSGKMKAAELDWLMSFPYSKEIQKIGTLLLASFLKIIKDNPKNNFEQVHIRSEAPEFTNAVAFYEKLGFKTFGKRHDFLKFEMPRDLLFFTKPSFEENDEPVIPMKMDAKMAYEMAETKFSEWHKKTYKPRSLNPQNYLSNYFKN